MKLPAMWSLANDPNKLENLQKKHPNFCKLLDSYKRQFANRLPRFTVETIECDTVSKVYTAKTSDGEYRIQMHDTGYRFFLNSDSGDFIEYFLSLENGFTSGALVVQKPAERKYYPSSLVGMTAQSYLEDPEQCERIIKGNPKSSSASSSVNTSLSPVQVDCLHAKGRLMNSFLMDRIHSTCSQSKIPSSTQPDKATSKMK